MSWQAVPVQGFDRGSIMLCSVSRMQRQPALSRQNPSKATAMHSEKSFRDMLRQGTPLVGTVLTMPSAAVAEVLADVGYDWL